MATVHILVRDPALRKGLFAYLQDLPDMRTCVFVPGTRGGPDDILLAAADSCTPAQCWMLKGSGFRVVILTAVARAAECRQYAEAGVSAYLPMALNGARLGAALKGSTG